MTMQGERIERDRLKVELANAKKSRDGYQCRLVDERALSAKLLEALERNLFDLEWCQKNHVHPDNSLAVAIENTRVAIVAAKGETKTETKVPKDVPANEPCLL